MTPFEPLPLYVDAPRLLHAKNSRFVCKEKIELLKKSTLEDVSLLPFLTGAEVLNNRYLSEKPEDFPNIMNMLNKCNATIADRLIYMLSEVYNNRIPIDNAEIIRSCTIQIFNVWIKDYGNWVDREASRGVYCCSFTIMNYLHEMMKEKTYIYDYYDREQLELIEMEMEWLNKKIPEGPIDGINQRFLVECMKRGRNMLFARDLVKNPDSNYELFRYIQKDGVWFFKEFTAVSLSCDLWITDYNTLV